MQGNIQADRRDGCRVLPERTALRAPLVRPGPPGGWRDGVDGVRTLTLQAQSYQPPSSNYATFSTRNQIGVLEFDASTQESARWVFHLPTGRTYGTLTVKVHWCTAATSGDGRWGVRIAKLSGVDIDSDSYDTAVEATTTTSGTAGLVNVTTLSSVGIDSAAAGDLVCSWSCTGTSATRRTPSTPTTSKSCPCRSSCHEPLLQRVLPSTGTTALRWGPPR